ncbi:MAG TPA: hypothetical protein VEB40_06175 [Flavipsychrobacter sp.]|nr:hypothetical protein [Flavipsychrobacter sp.]
MCAHDDKPISFVSGILQMKCPNCRRGDAFVNKSVFPLGKSQKLVERCEVCGQKMMHETNNGPGINYALTVIVFFLNLAWYGPIFGLSYFDNSLYYFMAVSTAIVLLIQPWTMRYSRILYLYMYVPFQSNRHLKA